MAPPSRQLFWIASLIKRKASTRPAHGSDVHCVAGRPARTTAGPAPAAMDFDTVSFLYPVVAAFRLVYAAMKHSKQQYESRRCDN